MAQLSFIRTKSGQTADAVKINGFIDALKSRVMGGQMVNHSVGKAMISLESINDSDLQMLETAGSTLDAALEAITGDLMDNVIGSTNKATPAQMTAATMAGLMAGDIFGHLSRPTNVAQVSTENISVIPTAGMAGTLDKRSFALEAYDERENRNAVVYSIAYNYQASRQDEFNETLWPTLTLTNENVGFGITVNLMMVYDAIERKISGDVTDFNKRNIIRAVKNPNILKKDQTRIIPVYRPASAAKFSAIIPSTNYSLEGDIIPTAPLAFGKKVDIVALSYTDALLTTGAPNQTDTLDPTVVLSNVYATVGTHDIIKFSTLNLTYSNFVAAPQNQYKQSNLNFNTVGLIINKNTKNIDGSALTDLAVVGTKDLLVTLEINITGTANVEFGDLEVYGNRLAVSTVQDNTGAFLDLTSGDGAAIVALFTAAKLDSYDVLAYRANMNRRQQGQLIDVTKFTQLYNVPLRSPITSMHPINNDGSTDASDVQALIATTRIRMSNDGVGALIAAFETLSQVTDPRAGQNSGEALTAIGKYYVVPTFSSFSIDMATAIDSISSHNRAADMQAVLVNRIRDVSYRLYRDSEYKAAADALSGGISKVPVVIIATDPVLARYINVEGDLRTLSGGFDVRVVSTLDERVQGKIFITFGVFDETRNTAPNPLNWGNMVWAPELVLSANISRSGISKETVCQPRYLYVQHLPIGGYIEVANVPDVLNKVSIDVAMTNVTPAP